MHQKNIIIDISFSSKNERNKFLRHLNNHYGISDTGNKRFTYLQHGTNSARNYTTISEALKNK